MSKCSEIHVLTLMGCTDDLGGRPCNTKNYSTNKFTCEEKWFNSRVSVHYNYI